MDSVLLEIIKHEYFRSKFKNLAETVNDFFLEIEDRDPAVAREGR